jgi:aryl-alcohol dehydrogenase-like predicted oxidoreductase
MDDALAAAGASLIPSAALAGGALSGKYADGGAGRLSDELGDPGRAGALQLGAALRRPTSGLHTTPATLAIAFTLLHPRTAATLIGATTPAQIDAAIDAVPLTQRLTPGDVAELRSLADSRLSAGALFTGGSVLPRDEAEDYFRTRNRRMVTAPDRVLLTGSRSILARPGEE